MIQKLRFGMGDPVEKREKRVKLADSNTMWLTSYDATTLIRCNFCHVLSVAWSHYYAKPVTHRRSVMSDLIAKNVKNCQHHHWFFLYIHTKKNLPTYIHSMCFINYDNYDVKRFKRVIIWYFLLGYSIQQIIIWF